MAIEGGCLRGHEDAVRSGVARVMLPGNRRLETCLQRRKGD